MTQAPTWPYKGRNNDRVAPTWLARTVGVIASAGSGSRISTLVALERSLNWLRAFTRYSMRLRLCLSTEHSTQISGFTFWLSRYVLCTARHNYCVLSDLSNVPYVIGTRVVSLSPSLSLSSSPLPLPRSLCIGVSLSLSLSLG
jgi:hypothetical protein